MKKIIVVGMILLMFAFCGCQEKNNTPENHSSKSNVKEELDTMEQLDGYDGLSEEEITQKMIEEADKIQVVHDKTK